MENKIINCEYRASIPESLKHVLPYRLYKAVEKETETLSGILEEIKIRKDRQSYIVIGGKNVLLPIVTDRAEIEETLSKICGGSLYAHRESIGRGYVAFDDGIRVGVCGRASIENGRVLGVYDVSELSIRIPNRIAVSSDGICEIIFDGRLLSGILIYAPPGIGKTTLLRSLIRGISSGRRALRCAVIDTRGELCWGLESKGLLVSVLSGYPIGLGIEIAVRSLNAQIIVCDEIGNENEASSIIDAHGCGVPLLASCHGGSVSEILRRNGIKRLHNERIFSHYVGIERDFKEGFIYTVTPWEEANDVI